MSYTRVNLEVLERIRSLIGFLASYIDHHTNDYEGHKFYKELQRLIKSVLDEKDEKEANICKCGNPLHQHIETGTGELICPENSEKKEWKCPTCINFGENQFYNNNCRKCNKGSEYIKRDSEGEKEDSARHIRPHSNLTEVKSADNQSESSKPSEPMKSIMDKSDSREAMYYIKELDNRLQALITSVMNLEIKVAQNRGYTTEFIDKFIGWQKEKQTDYDKKCLANSLEYTRDKYRGRV